MTEKINTHLANDLEQSAAMLDSREFDAVQLDNCASMMRYAATVIRQALANEALDKMADNARDLGLSYEQPAQQEPNHALVDELKKFYAMPPYNTSSNFVQGDGRFYKDIQASYKAEQIEAALVELGIKKGN